MTLDIKAAIDARDAAALGKAIRADRKGSLSARWVVRAAGMGWRAGLELLHARGADLNGSYKNYRPLHALIQEEPHVSPGGTPERNECLQWLLAHGADPELSGAWPSARAILVAAWMGEPLYVETLRAAGARIDGFVSAALGEFRKVSAGLAHQRDADGLTALHCCCASRMRSAGRFKAARKLLEAGADPDASVRSWGQEVNASYFAVNSGQLDTLELLIQHGACKQAALSAAAWKEDSSMADLLLRLGGDPDCAKSGDRPLLNDLIRWGQFQQARFLLGRGASPNVPDKNGWTALHQAVSRGNEAMVRDLLASGADPTVREATGSTPRAFAVLLGRARILSLLPA